MWTKIFETFVADHTLSFVVHVYLLSGDVLATIAVGVGILWEGIFGLKEIAHKLVIWGVVAETLCSVMIFTFDEGISAALENTIKTQQQENASLERALSPREFNSFALFRAVASLPRVPLFVNPINQEEPLRVARNIENSFVAFGAPNVKPWSVSTLSSSLPASISTILPGITIGYLSTDDKADLKRVGTAICETLKAEGLEVQMRWLPAEAPSAMAQWPTSVPTNGVIISVGEKPSTFWWNKKLTQPNIELMPIGTFCTSGEFFKALHDGGALR